MNEKKNFELNRKNFLYGRLIKKKLLKSVNFLEIITPKKDPVQVVVEDKDLFSLIKKIKEGSILEFKGAFKKTSISHKYSTEFQAVDIKVVANNYQQYTHPIIANYLKSKDFPINKQIYALASDKAKFLLEIRSFIVDYIRSYLSTKGFVQINSPKIVESLVEGPTNAFEIDFYGEKRYLSISNVLYHHILIVTGYNKFYEISPTFRQQHYNTKYQLSEFWVFDFSETWKTRSDMINFLEELLHFILDSLKKDFGKSLQGFGINLPKLPKRIKQVKYKEVLKWLGLKEDEYGTHLPRRLMEVIKRRDLPAIWIIDAPNSKKPFFIKRKNNVALSAELWTDRVPILASGGERVTDYKEGLENISTLNMNSDDFRYYLDALKFGAPPSCTIGMGIERLLQYLTLQPLHYFTPFPCFPKTKLEFI